jgi:hypothetical protein
MQTDRRARPVLDLADMMNRLPAAVVGSLAGVTAGAPRQNRRLPERILVAAHQACDLGDLDVAAQLLSILETVVGQGRAGPGRPAEPGRRRVMESLIAAHQRLWHLRHADELASSIASHRTGAGSLHPDFQDAAGFPERPTFQENPGFHESLDMTDFQPNA